MGVPDGAAVQDKGAKKNPRRRAAGVFADWSFRLLESFLP